MKHFALAGALAAAATLAGCAQLNLRLMESANALRVEPSTQPGYDYVISVRNLRDIGYDLNDPATRSAAALQMLSNQCPKATIVGETVIETGIAPLAGPARTYSIRVKCNQPARS